jgi:hypothetical protein
LDEQEVNAFTPLHTQLADLFGDSVAFPVLLVAISLLAITKWLSSGSEDMSDSETEDEEEVDEKEVAAEQQQPGEPEKKMDLVKSVSDCAPVTMHAPVSVAAVMKPAAQTHDFASSRIDSGVIIPDQTLRKTLDEYLSLLKDDPASLTDDEVHYLVDSGKLPTHSLEKQLRNYERAVHIRRTLICK